MSAAVNTTVADHGPIEVLVNNGVYQGRGTNDLFADLQEEDQYKLFEGNVHAQLAMIRQVLPSMLERGGGTIINMISATGYTDPPAKAGEGGWGMGYAMTKAAFMRVAPLLHVEHGDQGLRIFSVDPGFTVTERMEATNRTGQYSKFFKAATPPVIGRAIRWLATDPAADELRGKVVYAQREVKRRQLLPGWPPAED
jgi:NAD(P)-dependent dehydrogenase (short-subunit alcohol dehydrogenase family)